MLASVVAAPTAAVTPRPAVVLTSSILPPSPLKPFPRCLLTLPPLHQITLQVSNLADIQRLDPVVSIVGALRPPGPRSQGGGESTLAL